VYWLKPGIKEDPVRRWKLPDRKGWAQKYPGWSAASLCVDFPLLDTASLNARKMLGPDQYRMNPIPRAVRFISRFKRLGA